MNGVFEVKGTSKYIFILDGEILHDAWVRDNVGKYYIDKNGFIVTNAIVDGIELSADGVAIE